jgi:hypothetical protein
MIFDEAQTQQFQIQVETNRLVEIFRIFASVVHLTGSFIV